MNIYVTHSTGYDFRSELYTPLKSLQGDKYTFIFPHENDTVMNSREIVRTCDVVLAEVSYPSTGQGIELGWANESKKPIICIYRTGAKISGSLRMVSDAFLEYTSPDDLPDKVDTALSA